MRERRLGFCPEFELPEPKAPRHVKAPVKAVEAEAPRPAAAPQDQGRALAALAQKEPSHIMCIGWPTIRRLMAGEAVWFDNLQCGAVAADDLFHLPLLANFTDAEIAAEHKRRTEARPDRKTYMRDYMRKRRMTA